jgi:general secretion pathway protein A
MNASVAHARTTTAAASASGDAAMHPVLAALGLSHAPFPPTPDAAHYFATPDLERDLAEAQHCLLGRKGFVLLTGEVGQGKTTFLRRLLRAVEAKGARSSLIFNTFLQGPDLLAAVLRDFGLRPGRDAAGNITRLNRFLLTCWRSGTTCVLFIDDAQNLDAGSLELLRLLTNLESGQEKLLQIVLAGQPELEDALRAHGLRQLASRIVKHVRLASLDAPALARYVDFRLDCAGDERRIRLDDNALAALYRHSAGNPRRVHLIMDRCLYGVIAKGDTRIDAALVCCAAAEAGFAPTARGLSGGLARRGIALFGIALLVASSLVATAITVATSSTADHSGVVHGRG